MSSSFPSLHFTPPHTGTWHTQEGGDLLVIDGGGAQGLVGCRTLCHTALQSRDLRLQNGMTADRWTGPALPPSPSLRHGTVGISAMRWSGIAIGRL